MMEKKKKCSGWMWLALLLGTFLLLFALIAVAGWYVDPYMRYHAPRLDKFYYFYESGEERSVSPAIAQYIPAEGLITGTSMTENFMASEAEQLFGGTFQKLPLPGAYFGEVSNLAKTALQSNPDMRIVIRSLDMYNFDRNQDSAQGNDAFYLEKLQGKDIIENVQYLFNQDMIYGKTLPMLLNALGGGQRGIMDFDSYCYWGHLYHYGRDSVVEALEISEFSVPEQHGMMPGDAESIRDNVERNIISLAQQYPNTQFYCFFPPYSAAWWGTLQTQGNLTRQLAQERLVIELLLPYENIHLFSWNTEEALTCDLNNYKDTIHYAPWVNSWMLRQMASENGRLTPENYEGYLAAERALYEGFDYGGLLTQENPEENTISAFFEN